MSYDAVAELYERHHARRTALVARDLVATMAIEPGMRVLDVGTGTGVTAAAAHEAVGDGGLVVGIDPSLGMLGRGLAAGRSVRFAAGEALDLPFRNGTFDAETATFVLPQFAKQDTALFDLHRVLRPGGTLGVAVWGPSNDEFDRTWNDIAERYLGTDILRDALARMPWEDRLGNPAVLSEVLHRAEFRKIRIEPREYRFEWTRDDYIEGRTTHRVSRMTRNLLGEELWGRFLDDIRRTYAERFPERFGDTKDVLLAVSVRES